MKLDFSLCRDVPVPQEDGSILMCPPPKHVKEGVDLGLKNKLNDLVIDVIREHHGNSTVRFFYDRAQRQAEDARLGGKIMNLRAEDVPAVQEENFRYPGPNPQTKESGIICLADAVESASRSLQKPTPKKIDELIDDIFKDRLNDGQLDDAALTLADLATIKHSFAATLRSMMHSRIEYPKLEDGEKASKPKSKTRKLVPPGTAVGKGGPENGSAGL
jgi:membrane-associated HD superfamily phosphohydrolase